MRRLCASWWIGCLALLCTGCGGGHATIAQWQREVEQYVSLRGRGDPNVLRDLASTSSPPVLAVHGGEDPAQSTDVLGLLLGQRTIGGRPTMVFLVASVVKGEARDIRIATLLGSSGDRLVWRISDPDSKALLVYRGRKPATAGREHPPWPARDDTFELSVSPGQIMVTERTSGARWSMPLRKGHGDSVSFLPVAAKYPDSRH